MSIGGVSFFRRWKWIFFVSFVFLAFFSNYFYFSGRIHMPEPLIEYSSSILHSYSSLADLYSGRRSSSSSSLSSTSSLLFPPPLIHDDEDESLRKKVCFEHLQRKESIHYQQPIIPLSIDTLHIDDEVIELVPTERSLLKQPTRRKMENTHPPLNETQPFQNWIVVSTTRSISHTLSIYLEELLHKAVGWRVVIVGTHDDPDPTSAPSPFSFSHLAPTLMNEENETSTTWVWRCTADVNCIYLGPKEQKELNYEILKHVPVGSRNIGVLFALQHGAERIFETNDLPGFRLIDDIPSVFLSSSPSRINTYQGRKGRTKEEKEDGGGVEEEEEEEEEELRNVLVNPFTYFNVNSRRLQQWEELNRRRDETNLKLTFRYEVESLKDFGLAGEVPISEERTWSIQHALLNLTNNYFWPRGYPLSLSSKEKKTLQRLNRIIRDSFSSNQTTTVNKKVLKVFQDALLSSLLPSSFHTIEHSRRLTIQHSISNGIPDLSALDLLTNHHFLLDPSSSFISFEDNPPIAIPKGYFAPFNSYSTLYHRDALWATLDLSHSSSKVRDVWKSYWVQRLNWEIGGWLSFFRPITMKIKDSVDTIRGTEGQGAQCQTSLIDKLHRDYFDESILRVRGLHLIHHLLNWKPSRKATNFEQVFLESVDSLEQAQLWNEPDIQLARVWIRDLQRINYTFPLLATSSSSSSSSSGLASSLRGFFPPVPPERSCRPPSPYKPDPNTTPFAIAFPLEQLTIAFSRPIIIFNSKEGQSLWREWTSELSEISIVQDLKKQNLSVFRSLKHTSLILDLQELKMDVSLVKTWLVTANTVDRIVFYHPVHTFCAPSCGNDEVLEQMIDIADTIDEFLTTNREWYLEWEPLLPGKMSYPSPWILVNRWKQSKTSLDGITRRQFTPTCEADQLWYLDWFLRVGPAGGFAYAIFDTAEYLSDTLEWKDVKFGFSPEPWPTFFGTKEYLEWDNVRVCEGANIGCAFLPLHNCEPDLESSRVVDGSWAPNHFQKIGETEIGNLTQRYITPFAPAHSLSWLFRPKRFIRDEIRRTLEDLQIPRRFMSVHIRRGNKINEALHTPTENYFKQLSTQKISKARSVYIATDSNVAIRDCLEYRKDFDVFYDPSQKRFNEDRNMPHMWSAGLWLIPDQTLSKTPHWNNKGVVSIMVDLFFMTQSEVHVGTTTSNVFAVVNKLRRVFGRLNGISTNSQGALVDPWRDFEKVQELDLKKKEEKETKRKELEMEVQRQKQEEEEVAKEELEQSEGIRKRKLKEKKERKEEPHKSNQL